MTNDNRIRFTFRIPVPLFEALKAQAEIRGVSQNALLLQILWDWVKEQEKERG